MTAVAPKYRYHSLLETARDHPSSVYLAVLYLAGKFANSNNLERGLHKSLFNAVDLRKIGSALSIISGKYFGNAVGGSFCMPPDVGTALPDPAAPAKTTS